MTSNQSSLPLGTALLQAPFAVAAHNKKYSSIIFDLGGVLIDFRPAQLGAAVFPHTDASTIMQTLASDPLWLEFDRGTVSIEDLAEYGNEVYGFDATFTKEILEALPHHLPAVPDMVDLFMQCKQLGFKVYILSNISEPIFHAVTKKHDFFKQCDGIIASYTIKTNKPELGIYQHLLQQFNITPETALFIDDLEANIRAGNALGIDGIVCKNCAEVEQLLRTIGILPALHKQRSLQTNAKSSTL